MRSAAVSTPRCKWREQSRPLGVGGVEALVDHRCALGRVGGGFGVGGVYGLPVDTVGEDRRPSSRYRPHADTQLGQPGRQGAAHLSGAEDDVQRVPTHGFSAPRVDA